MGEVMEFLPFMLEYEHRYMAQGLTKICGVDEAGRGPLAGPVCVAAVMMPLGENDIIDGVNDSKKLSDKRREELYNLIVERAICYSIQLIDNNVIDAINILNATKLGMKQAIEGLSVVPDVALIDAVRPLNISCYYDSIIKGDELSYNIAAASILAKVSRDRLMRELAKAYPNHLFDKHKGYPTKEHYQRIAEFGVTEIHRKSFLKNII